MQNWIDETVERVKERDERRQREREWQLHKAAVMPSKAKRLWEELSACLERDVEAFNERFSNERERQFVIQKPSSSFVVRRTFFPSVELRIQVNAQEGFIEWKKITRRSSEGSHRQTSGRFRLDLHETDILYIVNSEDSTITCEECSEALLKPTFSLS
jgi:hypothetical protein